MGLQGEQHSSPGDVMRRLRQLEREVRALQSAQPLRSASIDSGGLTVKDGFIRWLDADGNETARFATAGLSLEGLLEVIGNIEVDGGTIEILDADGVAQMTLGTDGLTLSGLLSVTGDIQVSAGGALEFLDAGSNVVTKFDSGGFVESGADVFDDPDVTLGSSFTTMLSLSFTPPAQWGSYRVSAWGTFRINMDTDNAVDARIEIGASNGEIVDTFGGIVYVPLAHTADESGDITIRATARTTAGATDAVAKWGSLSFIAIRTS